MFFPSFPRRRESMGFEDLDDSLRSPFRPPLRAFNALRAFVPPSRE